MYIKRSDLNIIDTFDGFVTPSKVAADDAIKIDKTKPINFLNAQTEEQPTDDLWKVETIVCATVTSHQLRKKFFFKDTQNEDAPVIGYRPSPIKEEGLSALISEKLGIKVTDNWVENAIQNCDIYISSSGPNKGTITVFLVFVLRAQEVDLSDTSKWVDAAEVYEEALGKEEPIYKAVVAGVI